jgi:hypothetical protein
MAAGAPLVRVLLLLLTAAAAPGFGLDAADGRVRLTLIEGTGRFSVSCQTGSNGGSYVPLLATQDPRTTTLSVVYGNKIYRMGESSEFSEKAERVPGGARFVWKSSFLQVTETFSFVSALDSSVRTGVRIDLSLKNMSEQDITAGARYLFDTYLGEPSGVHFRTPALTQVNRETALTPADKAAWWVSPRAGDKDNFGLQTMLSGTGVTVPDRVVFANWKRLSDASWAYDTSSARNFSLLPYSVNDSAVAQYYEARPVPRSGEATITLVMGIYSPAGYNAAAPAPSAVVSSPPPVAPDFSSEVKQSLDEGRTAKDDSKAAQADLATVNAILNEIDAKIGSSSGMSDEELALIESALKDLGSRSGRYTSPSGK